MFEVEKRTVNNPFKPELVDNTTIVLRQKEPFVQMSYKYDGDFSNLTDEEAISKVLDDFYKKNYNDKIQEGKLTELELAFAKQQETLEEQLNTLVFQNELTSQAVIELSEILFGNIGLDDEVVEDELVEEDADEPESELEDIVPAKESEESEGETDEGDSNVDGDEDQE